MSLKSHEDIKKDLIDELDYITNLGKKIFVYPFIEKTKIVFVLYCFFLFLLLLTSAQLLTALCKTSFNDWIEIVKVTPNLGVVVMAIMKFTIYYIHHGVYNKILKHFRYDLLEVVSDSEMHVQIVTKYIALTKFLVRFLYYYSFPLVIIVNTLPRLIMYYEFNILGLELQYLYPFDGWYPFDKVTYYYVVYFWESCMTGIVVCVHGFFGMVNTLYTSFICMELKVLGNSLENLITTEEINEILTNVDVGTTHRQIKMKLRKIIMRHQLLAQ
jgi:hypothetical protein